jgi:hypothetical protein
MKKAMVGAVVVAAAIGLIAACGGGGGGGGGTDTDVCGGATLGCVTGVVQNSTGAAITSGITVTTQAAGAAAQTVGKAFSNLSTTNSQGWFSGDNIPEGEQVLCFQSVAGANPSYVKKCITVNIRAQQNTPIPPIKLPTRSAAQTINADTGGTANDPGGTTGQITFGGGTICDSSGVVVTGNVDCYLTPIDASAADMPDAAPETFAAIAAGTGAQGTMVSSALMEVTCEQGGAEVNICSGDTANVRVPIYDPNCATDVDRNPPNIDAWYFDEADGNWQDYGNDFARTCGATPNQNDSFYNGVVNHLTWINGDKWRDDACLTGLVYVDGTTLTGTNLTVQCWGSGWRNSAQVGTDGRFCIAVPKGYGYTCKVGDTSGWIPQTDWVTGTANGPIVQFPLATCPNTNCEEIDAFVFASPILTTTLTWGADPSDLDSHTFGNGVHVWFSDKSGSPATKGSLASSPFIALDTDDTTGYGPEVTSVMPAVADGKYCFGIHLYSGSGAMNQTSTDEFGNPKVATVTVTGNGVAQSFTAPSGTSTDYWRVYTVEFENGTVKSGSFTSVNDYVSEVPTDCEW